MQLTPAQIAVCLICGEALPRVRDGSLPGRIREGHDFLVKITRKDFGYDLQAWQDYLKESRVAILTGGTSCCRASCRLPSSLLSGKRSSEA